MNHFQAESGTGKASPQFAPEILFLGPSDKELGMTHKCTPPCLWARWNLKQQAVCPVVSGGRQRGRRDRETLVIEGGIRVSIHRSSPFSASIFCSLPWNPCLPGPDLDQSLHSWRNSPNTLGCFFWFLGWCPLLPGLPPWHFSYVLYYESGGDPCPLLALSHPSLVGDADGQKSSDSLVGTLVWHLSSSGCVFASA